MAHSQDLSTSTASVKKSYRMEDSVQDIERMSFAEIAGDEKRQVFQLGAVRRSMRHLPFGAIFMSEEILTLSKRFMEIGPARSSVMHMGLGTMSSGEIGPHARRESTAMQEAWYISPVLAVVQKVRGYHPVFFVLAVVAGGGEFMYARSGERASGRAGERASERASGRAGERASGQAASRRAGERAGELARGRAGERASGRASERAGERASGRAGGRASEAIGD
jgi:hypothetical protein